MTQSTESREPLIRENFTIDGIYNPDDQENEKLFVIIHHKGDSNFGLYDDKEQAEQAINEIITDRLIVRHTLSCGVCIKMGILECKQMRALKGVWA